MKYPLIIALILTASFVTAAVDLGSYPAPFVLNGLLNSKLVVGQNAATSDVLGAIDIAASLTAESQTNINLNNIFDRMGILDVDAPPLGGENIIVVGGPCANSVAAELLDYPLPCNKDFEIGKAMIRYFPKKSALLVAGYEAQETLAASYVLSDYQDYKLSGYNMEVAIVGHDVVAINSVT